MAKTTYTLLCTSAFMVGGKMITPGDLVPGVPEPDAKSLIRRGKAKVEDTKGATEDALALSEMSVDELKAAAEEYAIEGAAKMKKADLIAAIQAAEAE